MGGHRAGVAELHNAALIKKMERFSVAVRGYHKVV